MNGQRILLYSLLIPVTFAAALFYGNTETRSATSHKTIDIYPGIHKDRSVFITETDPRRPKAVYQVNQYLENTYDSYIPIQSVTGYSRDGTPVIFTDLDTLGIEALEFLRADTRTQWGRVRTINFAIAHFEDSNFAFGIPSHTDVFVPMDSILSIGKPQHTSHLAREVRRLHILDFKQFLQYTSPYVLITYGIYFILASIILYGRSRGPANYSYNFDDEPIFKHKSMYDSWREAPYKPGYTKHMDPFHGAVYKSTDSKDRSEHILGPLNTLRKK